jgi:uncharacterized protein YwlG (UPF0340 family)
MIRLSLYGLIREGVKKGALVLPEGLDCGSVFAGLHVKMVVCSVFLD